MKRPRLGELRIAKRSVGNVSFVLEEATRADIDLLSQSAQFQSLYIIARRGPLPRVFDAFIFYNELELLELRLNELSSVVDNFVLVEAGSHDDVDVDSSALQKKQPLRRL